VRRATIAFAAAGLLALGAAVAALADDGYGDGYGGTTTQPSTTAQGAGAAETYSFKTAMTTGLEVPKPKAPASAKGAFTATSVEQGSKVTITWKLTFAGLSGKAAAAHIHKGRPGKAGPVALALCGPCRSGQTGKAAISKAIEEGLEKGQLYVNVHTARNPAGEIRGQVKLVGTS
jgi:CHRD domain-containing protein